MKAKTEKVYDLQTEEEIEAEVYLETDTDTETELNEQKEENFSAPLDDEPLYEKIDIENILSHVVLETCDYDALLKEANDILFVTSRGGTGHVTAMNAIQEQCRLLGQVLRQYKVEQNKGDVNQRQSSAADENNLESIEFIPNKGTSPSMDNLITFGSKISQFKFVKSNLKKCGVITLPDKAALNKRINKYKRDGNIYSIDMMLDVVDIGPTSAAIWDEFQSNDQCDMLTQLVGLQGQSDKRCHTNVRDYFCEMLKHAHYNNRPYRRILSTQVIGLPALCDAVIRYHLHLDEINSSAPRVVIEQFMTDLPTYQASHYFNALKRLDKVQQTQMNLHAVALEKKVLVSFLGDKVHFKHVYQIDPQHNPMVRQSFKTIDNTPYFESPATLICKDGSQIDIDKDEKIAMIMLGGQAGADSVRYIEPLLDNGIDRVIVFGGDNQNIFSAVHDLLLRPVYSNRIIPLPNQDADFIAGLETRSLYIVNRGGGLCCFEHLARHHHPEQVIFIHYADSCEDYNCGIEWENGNVDELSRLLAKKGVRVEKIKPQEMAGRLQQLAGLGKEEIDDWVLDFKLG